MLLPVETALEGWTSELPAKAFPPSGWMVRAVGISSPSAGSHVEPCTPSKGPHSSGVKTPSFQGEGPGFDPCSEN